METKELELRDYLAKSPPLTELPSERLNELVTRLEVRRVFANEHVLRIGERNDRVYLIRSGAVEVFLENGELYGRFSEGDWVGYRSVMRGGPVSMDVKTLEDSVFYAIPADLFLSLIDNFNGVAQYFSERKPERLRRALQELRGTKDYSMITMQVRDLMALPMLVGKDASIQQVAKLMGEANPPTAMIVDENAKLCGIVTDLDFRKRVVAVGLDINQPIASIMTHNPLTLSPRDQASEALLLMARRNIRHIPVVDKEDVVGVISASDLLRKQSHNTVYLVGDIFNAPSVEKLAEFSAELPNALVGMVRQSLPAHDTGHAITSIGQAIARRLLIMAEEKYGPPPVPYAFIVAGSMARREQTAHSDQDNGMIISDAYDEAAHGDYFLNIAKYVSDGLNACGYVYCPGDVMATNKQWRQPWSVWQGYFNSWIDRPESKSLMYASIFFDLRCLHGDESLLSSLQDEVLKKTRASTLFQAFMASNALSHKPPLGFFRSFVLEKGSEGSDEKGMDMKKRGVVPSIDLARVYALAEGIKPIATKDRLEALAASGGLTRVNVNDLLDAFEFISMVRLQHQAKQIEKGQKPNNYVPPEELSALERRHLKDAFEVVSTLQDTMTSRYHADRFR